MEKGKLIGVNFLTKQHNVMVENGYQIKDKEDAVEYFENIESLKSAINLFVRKYGLYDAQQLTKYQLEFLQQIEDLNNY